MASVKLRPGPSTSSVPSRSRSRPISTSASGRGTDNSVTVRSGRVNRNEPGWLGLSILRLTSNKLTATSPPAVCVVTVFTLTVRSCRSTPRQPRSGRNSYPAALVPAPAADRYPAECSAGHRFPVESDPDGGASPAPTTGKVSAAWQGVPTETQHRLFDANAMHQERLAQVEPQTGLSGRGPRVVQGDDLLLLDQDEATFVPFGQQTSHRQAVRRPFGTSAVAGGRRRVAGNGGRSAVHRRYSVLLVACLVRPRTHRLNISGKPLTIRTASRR